jgi:hypothetical protein
MLGLQAAQNPMGLTAAVFNRLGFIENKIMETVLGQLFHITRHQGIGTEGKINIGQKTKVAGTLRSAEDQNPQGGREAGNFPTPISNEARRGHNQRRAISPRFVLDQQMRNGLKRFPQTHVVGQDAPDMVSSEMLQPA